MRGLICAGPTPARGTKQAAITALAVVAALALSVSACGTGGTGARDEGPAHSDYVAGATPSPASAAPSSTPDPVDAVRLVKADPQVSREVKSELKPCVGDEYPVDVSYGDLTGASAEDVVVNVLTCSDAVGVGSYVYRADDGRYENVFKSEEPPVYAEIDRGALVVTKQVYEGGDRVSSPSGEDVITYAWTSGRFVKKYSTRTEYSDAVGGEPSPVPDT
ncbi:hypothetical protein F7R91_29870 [Streptomyces luteolifulvus]|uniref:Lipoprotein CseA n=1 Tax=Streptomyces luteolifulvus TaxID=2615112 RepID=A0A6H9UT18_9ACTN|nr:MULTISPECIES: hypothetical protein [Streptomyces]KAB1142169.1 hypothetical protein F7R91_29870 [Streptomyces luteolifulvus]MXM66249.1 hypothetical protein [Streptomyces sp. HUCO-GS316]